MAIIDYSQRVLLHRNKHVRVFAGKTKSSVRVDRDALRYYCNYCSNSNCKKRILTLLSCGYKDGTDWDLFRAVLDSRACNCLN